MQNYAIITAPNSEPITLAEAKTNLRVYNSLENTLIEGLITAARKVVEDYSWRPIMTQTIDVLFDKNDVTEILLINKQPIQSITSVKYIDANGIEQTLAPNTDYVTDLLSQVGRVKLNTIPPMKDTLSALKIRVVCGYANAAAVPKSYIAAMHLIIAHLYENRQQAQSQALSTIPLNAFDLINFDHNRNNRT